MKAIIGGMRYDTAKAELVAEYWNGFATDHFDYLEEKLYVTSNGAWFLAGEGGARTRYAAARGGSVHGSSAITPVSPDRARQWLEQHNHMAELEQHFGDSLVDA
jgi:hypothetical protein